MAPLRGPWQGRILAGVRLIAVDGDRVTFQAEGDGRPCGSANRSRDTGTSLCAGGSYGVRRFTRALLPRRPRQSRGGEISGRYRGLAGFAGSGRCPASGPRLQVGRQVRTQTANGSARVWLVRIDELKLGELVFRGVEAAVHEAICLLRFSA